MLIRPARPCDAATLRGLSGELGAGGELPDLSLAVVALVRIHGERIGKLGLGTGAERPAIAPADAGGAPLADAPAACDRLVGAAALKRTETGVEVAFLGVVPAHRRCGLATRLVGAAALQLGARSPGPVSLDHAQDDPSMLALCEALGARLSVRHSGFLAVWSSPQALANAARALLRCRRRGWQGPRGTASGQAAGTSGPAVDRGPPGPLPREASASRPVPPAGGAGIAAAPGRGVGLQRADASVSGRVRPPSPGKTGSAGPTSGAHPARRIAGTISTQPPNALQQQPRPPASGGPDRTRHPAPRPGPARPVAGPGIGRDPAPGGETRRSAPGAPGRVDRGSAARVTIRPIGARDLAAYARLHADGWRESYRGLVADDYLDGRLAADADAYWRAVHDGAGSSTLLLIAEDDNARAVGAIASVPARPEPGDDEIAGLSVARAARGCGIGTALMAAVGERLLAAGRGSLSLEVLVRNHAARRLYARLGGIPSGPVALDLPGGGRTPEGLRIRWPALTGLVDAARARTPNR